MKSTEIINSGIQRLIQNPKVRELAIRVAGKALHLVVSGGDASLENTGKAYVEKTGLELIIDEKSHNALDRFKTQGRGLIVGNHASGIITDYLPIFPALGDDVLHDTAFYTGWHNLHMNKAEFGEYEFLSGNPQFDPNGKKIKPEKSAEGKRKYLLEKSDKPYQFWMDYTEAGFLNGIKRFIEDKTDDYPVLMLKVSHEGGKSYGDLAKALYRKGGIGKTTLQAEITTAGDWRRKTPEQKRDYWNELFSSSKQPQGLHTPMNVTNITPMMPSAKFMELFRQLDTKPKEKGKETEKGVIYAFLYGSLKTFLLDEEKIVDAHENRLKDLQSGNIRISVPYSENPYDNLTDEHILFGISQFGDFDYNRKSWRSENFRIASVFEHYINSSRQEKIAILKFLQKTHAGTTQRQTNNVVSFSPIK